MAVVNSWERRVLPQGGIADVQAKGGQILGQSLQQLGQIGQGAVYDIARAEKIQQQQDDSAWLGNQRPQAELEISKQIDALNDPQSKSYVDPTSADYEAQVDKVITTYSSAATKNAPSDAARAELANHIANLRVGYIEGASRYSSQSKIVKRIGEIDESNRKSGAILVQNPARFDGIVADQEKLIRSQLADPTKADAEVRKMKSTMAKFAMNGEASTNPQAFLKNMGKWGEQGAEPSDIALAQNLAEAEQQRRETKAKQEAAHRQVALQASVSARAADAVSSVQANGGVMPLVNGQPLITEKQIWSAYGDDPIRAQREIDKLQKAIFIGQAKGRVATNTAAEDAALSASLAPVAGGVFTEDDATVQAAVNAAIKAKQTALADEIEQDIRDSRNDAAATWNASAADWLQTAMVTGVVPDEARTAAVESGSADAKGNLAKLEALARLTQAKQEIAALPRSADRALAERLDLSLGATGAGSGAMAAQAAATKEALDAKKKEIADDPGGFFATTNPALRAGWVAMEENPSDPAVAENTVAMSVAAQERYGLSPDQIRPLPNRIAGQYAQTVMTAPPDQALATIDYVRSIAGDQGLRQVLGQDGIPNMAKFLAFADTPAQEPVRAAALESMKLKPAELDKLVKDRGFKDSDIDDQVTAVIQPLLDTLPPGAAGPYHDALVQITKLYVSKGMKPGAAAGQAWSAFDQAYTFAGTYRVPRSYDPLKVQQAAMSVIQKLDQFAIVPQEGAPQHATEGYPLAQTIRQLQTGGARWVTNADDTGLVLTYDVDQNGIPGPAVKTKTGRLEVLFSDLEAGKYGFAPLPAPGDFPNTVIGAGYETNPLGSMKPKGGKYAPNQSVIDYLKGRQ